MVAGLARPGYFEEQDIKLHKQLMEVNYFGCVNTTKVVLPHLIERNQGGKLVYFSSAVAICGMIGYTQYCPSKFALRGFCDSLKNELLPYRIDVHLFLPSNIDTPGFVEENKTKPIETQIIEGQGQTFSAEQVTKDLFNGIAKGQYTITNEILIEFGRICSDGPVQTNNIFLDMFVMPIVPLFRFIFQMVQYVVVKKYSKQRLEKAKKSKETANKKEN